MRFKGESVFFRKIGGNFFAARPRRAQHGYYRYQRKAGGADGQERPLVLIVDDSAFNRELLPNILHSEAETKPGCPVGAKAEEKAP